ncbi:hypothetical protein [Neoaquamicrobium sediminum]|uniref:hypothetical protein n=1 Tax=Neoaquamicrobium sediminum TaxID=1849104 RepID=UPI003BABC956
MVGAIVRWITGDLVGQLTRAYEARLKAQNETDRLVADALAKDIEAKLEAQRLATQIRLETAGFWEMRLLTFVIAGCFAFHLLLVTIDTCFRLGWRIPAYPSPFDEWQGAILLSFFGVQVAGQGITAVAAAIRGRK